MFPYQHLLVCLAEEGGEVGKECDKALRFGLHDHVTLDPTGPRGTEGPTNAQKLVAELNDFMAVVTMLEIEGVIPPGWQNFAAQDAKMTKVRAYMQYAKKVGTLEDEPISHHRP